MRPPALDATGLRAREPYAAARPAFAWHEVARLNRAAHTISKLRYTITKASLARPSSFDLYSAVSDPVKPSTPVAMNQLHRLGLKVIMLTGDNERTANAVARNSDWIAAGIVYPAFGLLLSPISLAADLLKG